MTYQPVVYRVSIPETVLRDPVQAVVDGLTIIHQNLGIAGVERALETVIDVMYSDERVTG